jgi:hypothetical protein
VGRIDNEPCGFAWTGDGSVITVTCPRNWECELGVPIPNTVSLEYGPVGPRQAGSMTARFLPQYDPTDPVQRPCDYLEKDQAASAPYGLTVVPYNFTC